MPERVPYGYLEQLARERQAQDDPVEATVRAMQAQRVRRDLAQSGDPEAVARVTRAARAAGVTPVLVEDRVDEVEAGQRASAFADFISQSSAMGRWAAANPRGAVAASDDTESLWTLANAWEGLKNTGNRLYAGGVSSVAGLLENSGPGVALPAVTLPLKALGVEDPWQSFMHEQLKPMRDYAGRIREQGRAENWWADTALTGVESVPITAAAALTRNPTLAVGIPALSARGQALSDAQDKGLTGARAEIYGDLQGGLEYVTEHIPGGTLVEALVKRTPFGKAVVRQLATELPGEQVATATQDFVDWAMLPENKDKTFGDYLAERPGAALQTAVATVSGTTAQTALARSVVAAADAGVRVSDRVGQARQARVERRAMDDLARGAEGSKLRQRDPEAFRELVRHQAEEAGTGDVFIPGEAIRAYQQTDDYRPADDPFAEYNVEEAAASGGDVVIPIQDFLTDVVGTKAWNAVRDDVRLTPGGMSTREAQSFDEAMDDVMAQMSDEKSRQDASEASQRTVVEKLTDRLAEQFGVSYTAPTARAYAELQAQRMVARAAVLGRPITEQDLDGFEVRQVLPEGVAQAVKADQLDLVINALRQGKPVESGVGPSLLEFIKERGGVNDTGGDLAAMGIPAKFLREFDPRQTEMTGGLSGAGDFGLDTTLRAAIEAGFFPDLANVENEAGPSQLDTQRLLDALAEEAAGRPVHAQTRTDPVRAAAEDLRAMLEQSNLNPDTMSDDEIRSAVEGMASEESGGRAYQQLPDTLEIDGVQRPTRNSEGQPIAGSEEGVRAFYKWFGDSKVVDAEGRPLVVYHGTGASFEAFEKTRIGQQYPNFSMGMHFASDQADAEHYAEEASRKGRGTRNVVPVYLRIETPIEIDAKDRFPEVPIDGDRREIIDNVVRSRREAGPEAAQRRAAEDNELLAAFGLEEDAVAKERAPLDGVVSRSTEGAGAGKMSFVVFEPTQIKSVNNRGTFDPSDPRILYQAVYHGSPMRGLTEVQPAPPMRQFDNATSQFGAFFAPDQNTAKRYAGPNGRVYEVDLDLQNPYEMPWAEFSYFQDPTKNADGTPAEDWGQRLEELKTEAAALRTRLEQDGHDGINVRGGRGNTIKEIAAFYAVPVTSSFEQEARGRIIFDGSKRIIELFQSRNLSTPLHELSHMWLEELAADASLPDAPEQLKADWETAKRYFAANGHKIGKDGQIPTEAHELWARSGERYLMEGKAPSSALVRLFEQFRGWLVNTIYKTVDKLRAPITPEIREVFDRLLATDEEIAAARERQGLAALFKDAAEAGMTKDEFDAHQRQVDDARAGAHAALIDKTMKAYRNRANEQYRESRKKVRAEEQERIDGSPLYKALAGMKENRVSREWIVDEMGEDALGLLPVRVPPLYVEGGAHPDIVAEQSGYSSGREMLEAVIGAEKAHRANREGGDKRSMRERAIETATDEEMNRRWGDPLNDGSIEREALAAVQSEMQGEVIAFQLRVLSRRTGRRPTPYQLAREWARGKVRAGTVAQEASPAAIQRYARNAAKAGREAEKAMLAQDADEAFRQKQFQMLNTALLVSAKEAHDEVTAAVKRMDRTASAKTIKGVDQDYLDQAHVLLEAVDLKQRSQKSLNRKASFEKWLAQRTPGEEVYVPDAFDWTGTHWTRMSTEALLGLDDTVKSILHLGRLKTELRIGKEKRDWNEARGEWLEAAEPLAERPATEDRNKKPSKVRGLFSVLIRIDMMARIMDAGNPNGLMTRMLAHGSKDADNTYARIHKEVMEPLIDAYMAMTGNRLTNRVTVPEWTDHLTGRPTTFMRSDLLAIALNLGNESSLRKMIAGEALLFKGREELAPTLAGIEQMLFRELNEAEWKMVELAWRRVDSMFPEIAETERELTGIVPEKVEPRMVATPNGLVEGGYWPVVYDSDPIRTAAAGVNLAQYKETDLERTLGLTGKGVGTAKGHTVTRTDYVAPLFLNFEGVLFGHVDQVAKRIAYQRWGSQAIKVIRDPRIKAMWARKLGPEYHAQLEPWLRDTINRGVAANTGHLAALNGILKQTRMNLTIMGLVGRFSTLVAQVGGLTSSAKAIGLQNLLNGFSIVGANYGATKARIYAASPLMARRINEFDRDQAAALEELARPKTSTLGRALKPLANARDRWNAFGFHAIGAVQLHLVDIPTWAGAYAQATASKDEGGLDMDHDRAVDYADLTVEQAQGAGRTAQLAAVQRAGEASRILTLFYTFFGTQLNYQWEMTQDVRNGRYGKAANSAFWIMVVTPLIAGLIGDAIRGDLPDDDDDDSWLAWVTRKIFFGLFSGIPIVRDFANTAERKASGKYAPDAQTPWQRLASGISGAGSDAFAEVSQTDWYRDAERTMPFLPDPKEVSDKWLRHAIEALGFATGTGLGQVAATSQFVADVNSGEARPESPGDYVEGVVTGRVN